MAIANIAEEISDSPVNRLRGKAEEVKRRGVKPGTTRGPYNKSKPEGAETTSAANAPPAPAFNPQNFKRLMAIPSAYMEYYTGVSGWSLSADELEELAINGVPAFNETIPIAPKWIHWTLFAISVISIATTKILGYFAYLRELARQRLEASRQKSQPEVKPVPVSGAAQGDIPSVGPLTTTKTPPMN